MSGKDCAVHKNTTVNQTGKNVPGKNHKSPISAQTEKSSEGLPSSAKIHKPPSPPLGPGLSGKISKTSNIDIVRERKPLVAVPKLQGSHTDKDQVSQVETNDRPELSRKPKETSARKPPDHRSPVSEAKPPSKDLDKRSDPLRKSRDMSFKAPPVHRSQVQEERTAIKDGDKRSDPLRKSRETSIKAANGAKASGTENNAPVADAQKLPRRPKESSAKPGADHNSPGSGQSRKPTYGSLCHECRAASQAVCFIGNDGRVSACSTGSASLHPHHCKSPRCASNNPDYALPSAVPRRKYLVSKRHLQKSQTQTKDKSNRSTSPAADQNGASSTQSSPHKGEPSPFSIEQLEDLQSFSDDGGDFLLDGGIQSASYEFQSDGCMTPESVEDYTVSGDGSNGKISSGFHRVRRSSIGPIEEQEPETVTLRKQAIQDRKQAEEWMLNYAIEEAVHKLAPNGETRVKVLVEAFESVISHPDGETPEPPTVEHHSVPPTRIAMRC